MQENLKEHVYFVKGTHCASCELMIEKKLLEFEGVKSVEADSGKGRVLIEYSGARPSNEELNRIFEKENYVFSDHAPEKPMHKTGFLSAAITAIAIIAGFIYLNKLGFSGLVNVSSKSSLVTFFGLGIVAGISSCAALVGGMVLSMSKQWSGIYSKELSTAEKLEPHIMFNIGRIASYAILGSILGLIGSRLSISFQFTSFLVIAVSIIMALLGLQMLGVKALRKFQITLPKSATRYISNEKNFKGRYMPLAMGALTFFLPCGFTITAQGLALLSGNPIQGGLIMSAFALGTAPALLLIGLSAVKLSSKPHLSYKFSQVAGILILFFALFNINSQLSVLGFSNFSDIAFKNVTINSSSEKGFVPIVDGKQIIKMNASASGYAPNYFKVKAGVPVKWQITDTGTSGCTNAVVSKGLFDGQISLTPGETSVKEFTPIKAGKYKFSCWMGMVTGTIEVVDGDSSSVVNAASDESLTVPSGAKGCGCSK